MKKIIKKESDIKLDESDKKRIEEIVDLGLVYPTNPKDGFTYILEQTLLQTRKNEFNQYKLGYKQGCIDAIKLK